MMLLFWNKLAISQQKHDLWKICDIFSSRRTRRWIIWENTMKEPCKSLAPQMKVSWTEMSRNIFQGKLKVWTNFSTAGFALN